MIASTSERRVRFLTYDEESQASEEAPVTNRYRWWLCFLLFLSVVAGTASCVVFFNVSTDTITVCLSVGVFILCFVMAWNVGACASRAM